MNILDFLRRNINKLLEKNFKSKSSWKIVNVSNLYI